MLCYRLSDFGRKSVLFQASFKQGKIMTLITCNALFCPPRRIEYNIENSVSRLDTKNGRTNYHRVEDISSSRQKITVPYCNYNQPGQRS